jgi:hypothetical protein
MLIRDCKPGNVIRWKDAGGWWQEGIVAGGMCNYKRIVMRTTNWELVKLVWDTSVEVLSQSVKYMEPQFVEQLGELHELNYPRLAAGLLVTELIVGTPFVLLGYVCGFLWRGFCNGFNGQFAGDVDSWIDNSTGIHRSNTQ